jgi:VWFA-related protein
MTGRRVAGALLAGFVATAAVRAQAPPQDPAQPPKFRAGVDVVVVEATVLDRREDVVRGLGPADFSAEVGGRRREVVSAELVEYTPPSPDAAGGGDFEITTNDPVERGRTVLLMVDQSGLRPESRGVMAAAQRWVRSLGPKDRVGLIAFPRGGVRIEFTTDHERVAEALSRVVGSDPPPPPFSYYNVSIWEATRIVDDDAFVTNEVVQRECKGVGDPYCPRNIEIRAETMVFDAKAQAFPVLESLRSLVEGMGATPGPKHAVLISPGWGLIERDAAIEIGHVAAAAARSNVTVHTLTAEQWALAAARGKPQTTPMQDQNLLLSTVEMLSGMTGGRAVRLTASYDSAFTQLNGGLSGYYRLGIRALPEDLDGKERRITLNVTRPGTQLASYRRVLVAPPPAVTATADDPEAVLRDALKNGTPLSALGLRATTYVLHATSAPRDVRVVVAGDLVRATPGKAKVVAALYELEGRPVNAREAIVDVPASGEATISMSVDAPPGSYGLRLAVLDADGRAGSLERLVDARWKKAGRVETPGLVLFHARPGSGAPVPVFDGVDPGDEIVVQLALGGGPIAGTQVALELRALGGTTPLMQRRARIAQTTSGQTVAHDALPASLLPPGRYTLGARIGDTALARAFRVRAGTGAPAATAPALARPPFEIAAVLDPAVVEAAVGRLAGRPDVTTQFSAGLDRLRLGELDDAAATFRAVQQAIPDFAPALVYLGACYAAGTKDREAISAWQRAQAIEPSPIAQRLAIDAWLRAGAPASAQALVTQARERWPTDPAFERLQAQVTLAEGRTAEGLGLVANLREPDPSTLLLALSTLYDAARRGAPIQDAAGDLETMRRLRERYAGMHGESLGLVDAWIAAVGQGAAR